VQLLPVLAAVKTADVAHNKGMCTVKSECPRNGHTAGCCWQGHTSTHKYAGHRITNQPRLTSGQTGSEPLLLPNLLLCLGTIMHVGMYAARAETRATPCSKLLPPNGGSYLGRNITNFTHSQKQSMYVAKGSFLSLCSHLLVDNVQDIATKVKNQLQFTQDQVRP
jgi:hypothetical protein